ncbi:MAG: Iron-sulfur cluster insertion protein ErpA [Chlamydiae bacterium]|nr:Iron-sulfur cluster insertion protein ErpA [Chlamydiota bacterium]
MNKSNQIHKEMTIEEILSHFPQKSQKLAQAMQSKGLHCVGCHAATWETLEMGVLGHGMDEEDLQDLTDTLNAILQERVDATTITMTAKAADKYRAILKEDNKLGYGLRFMEKAGGCSGFEYSLDYSEKALEGDQIFLSQGIEIHIPKTIVDRLMGCEIDYIDGLQGAGFKVSNPNVKSSCSCGTSHNY